MIEQLGLKYQLIQVNRFRYLVGILVGADLSGIYPGIACLAGIAREFKGPGDAIFLC